MNAAKYAQAREITVRLRHLRAEASIQLEIQDDGQGFEMSAIPAGHFGIGMMRERARAAGATLRISSRPEQGTRISIRWAAKEAATSANLEYVAADRAKQNGGRA